MVSMFGNPAPASIMINAVHTPFYSQPPLDAPNPNWQVQANNPFGPPQRPVKPSTIGTLKDAIGRLPSLFSINVQG